MGYVERSLMPTEEILHKAKVHWIIYLYGIVLVSVGVYFFNASVDEKDGAILGLTGVAIAILGIFQLIKSFIYHISTELVITNKRIFAKFGFIKRESLELSHKKVESLFVKQSILERIFNAGSIVVQGTGGGKIPIPSISKPLVFRRNAMEIIESD